MGTKRGRKQPAPATIRRAAHMACAGKSYMKTGECLGKSKATIASWKRKYPKIWDAAVAQWPIFNHGLARQPLNAEQILDLYCDQQLSLEQVCRETQIEKPRLIRFLDYLGIERRRDSEQNIQNTLNDLDIKKLCHRYRRGASLQQLASGTGKAIGTIRRRLVAAGVQIRGNHAAKNLQKKRQKVPKLKKDGTPRRRNPLTIARIKTADVLYKRGHNYVEIATALGNLSRQAIGHYTDDPLWTSPLRNIRNDPGRGFVPHTNAKELLDSYLKAAKEK